MLATNCLGLYLLTRLFLPLMLKTAAKTAKLSAADGSSQVRIAWTSSIVMNAQLPASELSIDDLTSTLTNQQTNYAHTKLGNCLLSAALAAEVGSESRGRILSVTYNPGNLKSNLTRHMPWWMPLLEAPLLYHAKYGAYTAIWAGLSTDLRLEHGGSYIVPWGRLQSSPRADFLRAMRPVTEGGSGLASQFQAFCDSKTNEYR